MTTRTVDFDPYQVLGVHPMASSDQIRAAYRYLARQEHPDMGGDAGRFSNIAEAYEILTDPYLRAQYDAGRMTAPEPTPDPGSWHDGFSDTYEYADTAWSDPYADSQWESEDSWGGGHAAADPRPTLGEYGVAGATWATDKVGVILSRRLWFWLLGVNVAATLIAAAAPLAYRTDYPWLVHVNVVLPISFYGSIALIVIAAAVYVADRVDAAWKRRRRSTSLTTFQ